MDLVFRGGVFVGIVGLTGVLDLHGKDLLKDEEEEEDDLTFFF